MRKVLITGASGFVGRACLPVLHAHGFEIHAISAQAQSEGEGFVHWHRLNLLHNLEVESVISQVAPTHLLHLGWCHAVPGKYWDSIENIRWIDASMALLRAFNSHGGNVCRI
jgi:nucleoside-diphosphate-sugar epimerase